MARVSLMAGTVLLAIGALGKELNDKSAASLRAKVTGRGHHTKKLASKKIVKQEPEIDQTLLICNAYASPASLDVYHVQTMDQLTDSAALRYKECREFNTELSEGDQLDFKAGNLDVGTFYATGLPQSSSTLLLIPHRRDSRSAAISFESHAFTDLQSPQIAVVDAYKGKERAALKIMEDADATKPVEEMLKFSSVVAVNAGNYKVALMSGSNTTAAASSSQKAILVQDQAKYVVMRVGIEPTVAGSAEYPQELVVFPSSTLRLSLSLACLALSSFLQIF